MVSYRGSYQCACVVNMRVNMLPFTNHVPLLLERKKLYGILSLAHVPPVHVLARVAHCACDSLA